MTKQNTDFLHLIERFHGKLEPPKLSKTSKQFLMKIIKLIKQGAQKWKGSSSQILQESSIPKGTHYQYLQNTLPDIHNYLESNRHIGKLYEFSIGVRSFSVYLTKPIYKGLQESKEYDIMDKEICKIYLWLYVCSHISEKVCSQKLAIFIYMTDLKKMIPENGMDCLSYNHVNTAFTLPCPHYENEIYIFRCEEWFKVLIHETIHSFGIDFALSKDDEIVSLFRSIFPIQSDFEFTETYAEIWGEIINIVFVSLNTQDSAVLKYSDVFKTIEYHIRNEQLMSIFQIVKILDHMKMKYRELYIPNNPYNEKTNVFAYYFLKSVLMFHINEFIEWCHIHNGSLQFKSENMKSFFEFIIQRFQSENYLKLIDFFDSWFSKNKNNLFVMRSLRLSITE